MEIVAFVDRDSIDPIRLGEGNHYLRADGQVAAKPYVLLRKALERTDKVAIAKFALRGRERLGMLRIKGDALLLNGMHWDEIPDGKAPTEQELQGALALLETMSIGHLDDIELVDHYRDALVEVIEAKAEHRQPAPVAGEEAPAGQVVDLMAALEESVAKAKEALGETGEHATVHEIPKAEEEDRGQEDRREADSCEEGHGQAGLLGLAWAKGVSVGRDVGEGALEAADRIFGFRVLLGLRRDGTEGGAVFSRQGAPVQDGREGGGSCAQEPGQASVDMGEGDGHSGDRFPQVCQPVDRGLHLLNLCGADGGLQVGGRLLSNGTVVVRGDPRPFTDESFGFLREVIDGCPHVHARHSKRWGRTDPAGP
ncbi:Ku protein [Streptomyces sp. NPDC056543]|uniref:Ku protein n=1 Tax=unclassified Streptomyces TaxID=2593676 RepID=UPI003693FE9D